MSMLLESSLVVIVFTLGLLIFIHELGHFIVGRLCGMAVQSFSIGFGPALFSFNHRGTAYRIGIIPLGGYVQFVGAHHRDPVPEHFKGGEIYKKPIFQRALMTLAGPVANLGLAIVALSLIALIGKPQPSAVIGVVEEGSRAWRAGLQSGDRVQAITNQEVHAWSEMSAQISQLNRDQPFTLRITRGDQQLTLTVPPGDTSADELLAEASEPAGETEGQNAQKSLLQKKRGNKIGIIYGALPNLVRVLPGSPAEAKGIISGTRVEAISIGGDSAQPMKTFAEMTAYVATKASLWPAGSGLTISVHTSSPVSPDNSSPSSTPSPFASHSASQVLKADGSEESFESPRSEVQNIITLTIPADDLARLWVSGRGVVGDHSDGAEVLALAGLASSEMMVMESMTNTEATEQASEIVPENSSEANTQASSGEQQGLLSASGTASSSSVSYGPARINLMKGDVIRSVEGAQLNSIFDWVRELPRHQKSPQVALQVLRGEEMINGVVQQISYQAQEASGAVTYYRFPVLVHGALVGAPNYIKREGFLGSFYAGIKDSYRYSTEITSTLWGLVRGNVPLGALGGPIMIAKVARDSAKGGWVPYLTILAIISLNLFLINLVPIPVLDGGQLMLLLCEAIKGSRLSITFIENYQRVGVVMVLALVLLTTYNDLSRFWVGIMQSLGMG